MLSSFSYEEYYYLFICKIVYSFLSSTVKITRLHSIIKYLFIYPFLEYLVKYCHNCGYKLTLGTEKFCPNCGQNLNQQRSDYDNKVSVHDTRGDVIGTGVSGSGHIIGKEIGYTVQGNVINLQISGGVSNEALQTLQKIIAVPTQIDQAVLKPKSVSSTTKKEDIENKIEESITARQQIKSISEDVDKIGKKEGTKIEEIRAENIQISRNELLSKEYILKGNEHYYKKEYYDAISWY